MKKCILTIFFILINSVAYALIDVNLEVNRVESGYRVIFNNEEDDFAINQVGDKVEIILKPSYAFNEVQQLISNTDLVKSVRKDLNSLIITLAKPDATVTKYRFEKYIGLDISHPDYVYKNYSDLLKTEPGKTLKDFSYDEASVFLSKVDGITVFNFESSEIIGAAALQYGTYILLVFDNLPKNLKLANNLNYGFITGVTQLTDLTKDTAVIFKIDLSEKAQKYIPTLKRSQNLWQLTFNDTQQKVDEIQVLSKLMAAPYPKVEVNLEENSLHLIRLTGDIVGGDLYVVPKKNDLSAAVTTYKYIDFLIPQSVQGLFIKPLSDSLLITAEDTTVSIQKSPLLTLSKKLFQKTASYEEVSDTFKSATIVKSYNSILTLKAYDVNNIDYNDTVEKFRMQLNNTQTLEDNLRIRSNLALFYTANQMYVESNLIIKTMRLDSTSYAQNYNILLIEMVNYFAMDKLPEAMIVNQQLLVRDTPVTLRKEVRFWKSLIGILNNAAKDDSISVDPYLLYVQNANFFAEYTDNLMAKIGFVLIDQKFKEENYSDPERLLRKVQPLITNDTHMTNMFNYDFARFYARNNDTDNADIFFAKCLDATSDEYVHARCMYEKSSMDLWSQKISRDEHIYNLELISLLWHGDDFEMEVLNDLANTYESQKDYLNTLRTLNKIASFFPFSASTLTTIDKITNIYTDFFLNGLDKKKSHIYALVMFYEMQKYLPIGEKGDDIVLRFVDHLIDLDLLDRAAAILNHQINHRLKGFKKEEAINTLAMVHNRNGQPYYAIELLAASEDYDKLPDYIGIERKFLFAEAFFLDGREEDCMQLLYDDYSVRADSIKSEIFWQQQQWSDFLNYAEPRIYELRKSTSTLDEDDEIRVLKVAIAYLLSQKNHLMKSLASDFEDRFQPDSQEYAVFKVIVDSWKSISENGIASSDLIKNIDSIIKELSTKKF
jgi:hypothetical protein